MGEVEKDILLTLYITSFALVTSREGFRLGYMVTRF